MLQFVFIHLFLDITIIRSKAHFIYDFMPWSLKVKNVLQINRICPPSYDLRRVYAVLYLIGVICNIII